MLEEIPHDNTTGRDKGQIRTVQSIERAFSIIDTIARSSEPPTLAEISKAIGLHTSTTFHLLKTLCHVGALRQDGDKTYRIGSYIFGLAAGAMTEINLVNDALPQLDWLASQTGETSHIAVMADNEVIILHRVEGKSPIKFSERVGSIRPAYCTAVGRALLAHLSEARFVEYMSTTKFVRFTEHTVTSKEKIKSEVALVKEKGIAVEYCEFNAEIRCIAAPVTSFDGTVIAAIGISGPVWRVSNEDVARYEKQVLLSAQNLSAELGHVGNGAN